MQQLFRLRVGRVDQPRGLPAALLGEAVPAGFRRRDNSGRLLARLGHQAFVFELAPFDPPAVQFGDDVLYRNGALFLLVGHNRISSKGWRSWAGLRRRGVPPRSAWPLPARKRVSAVRTAPAASMSTKCSPSEALPGLQ